MTPPLELSGPVYCNLELTPACDNRCPGCSNVFVQEKAHRSTHLPPPLGVIGWRQVLEKLCPYVHSLRLTGGEPTLHPEFAAIVRAVGELDLPFSVFTNGRWHESARLVALLREIPQLRSLLISLHGANDTDHAAFCGIPGAFEETVANITCAVRSGLRVNTNTVITDHNFDDIPAIARTSRDLGASYAVFNRLIGDAPCAPSPDQLRRAIHQVMRLRSKGWSVRLGVCVPQCFLPNPSMGCLAGVTFWTIDPWGGVRPCNHAPLSCGNLLEQEIAEIVNSPALAYWHDLVPSECMDCIVYSQCHGGCRAQAMLLGYSQDDLIREPLDIDPNPPLELVLPDDAHPIARFEKRAESFGWLLIRGGRVQPVSHSAETLLGMLDGSSTLAEIEHHFGQVGLSFVGQLIRKGLVALEENTTQQ